MLMEKQALRKVLWPPYHLPSTLVVMLWKTDVVASVRAFNRPQLISPVNNDDKTTVKRHNIYQQMLTTF